jgi:hypothetical protein
MKRACVLLVISFLLLLNLASAGTSQTKAQEEHPWEIVFLAPSDDALYVINEQGLVETIQSEALSHISEEEIYSLALSPNREYLAYSAENVFIDIVNLKTNAWMSIPPPFINEDAELVDLWMGDFNPENTHFAFGFWMSDPNVKYGVVGGVATRNLLTNRTEHYLLATDDEPWYPLSVGWNTNGVQMILSTNYYEPPVGGYVYQWIPGETNYEITDRFWSGETATLPLTNEVVASFLVDSYPSTGESGYAGIPHGNVLRYFSDGGQIRDQDELTPEVIYFDANDLSTDTPIWVMDGAGILHHDREDAYHLILRDGTQVALEIANRHRVWGTTTGWLVRHTDGFTHYRYENGEIAGTTIWQYEGKLYILQSTDLGEASTGTFATIPPFEHP